MTPSPETCLGDKPSFSSEAGAYLYTLLYFRHFGAETNFLIGTHLRSRCWAICKTISRVELRS